MVNKIKYNFYNNRIRYIQYHNLSQASIHCYYFMLTAKNMSHAALHTAGGLTWSHLIG